MTEMKFTKVAVLGAGVMGAQIAVHLINARVVVVLFDLAEASGNRKLVIWMPDGLFAAGFGLKMLLDLCVKEEPQAVEIGLPALQQLSFRLRYALAVVLSCGSVADDTWESKAFLLDMECVAFIAPLAETRTQEHIEGMVRTGQPVFK